MPLPTFPVRLAPVALVLWGALGAGAASAQVSEAPDAFVRQLGGRLADGVLTAPQGPLRFTLLDGLVSAVEFRGKTDDTAGAGRVLAVAFGWEGSEDRFRAFLEEARARLLGAGPTDLGVADSFRLKADWTPQELRLTVELARFDLGADRWVLGTAGPVVREFSDFQCPYCGKLRREVLDPFKARFVATGRARFSYRQFPLDQHPNALPLALGSECAGDQGRFFPFHDAAFETPTAAPEALAKRLGLDAAKFAACLKAPATLARVKADMEIAERALLSGTPTVYVGPFKLGDPYDLDAYERFLRLAAADARR